MSKSYRHESTDFDTKGKKKRKAGHKAGHREMGEPIPKKYSHKNIAPLYS